MPSLSGFVVWKGYYGAGTSMVSWIGGFSSAQLVALLVGLAVLGVLLGQWWFLIHLLRQNGRLLVRLEALEERLGTTGIALFKNGVPSQSLQGLPVGSQAPDFSLSGLYGEKLTLESLRSSGKPVMLLFTDPNCGPCTAMLPEIGRWQQEHKEKLIISLISRGKPDENRAKSTENGLQHVLLQEDWEVSEAYEVRGTPSAVLVQPDGTISSPAMDGVEAIRTLLTHAVGERAHLTPDAAPTSSRRGTLPQLRQGAPC